MRRAWVGLALLGASWLFGLSYYHDADWLVWVVLIAAGTGLLYWLDVPRPGRGSLVAAAVLLVEHTGQTEQQVRDKTANTDSLVGQMASGRRMVFEPDRQARLWKCRKDAGPLLYRKRSRKHPAEFMEDVSVDYKRLENYISGLQEIGKRYDIAMSFFFGD